MKEKMEAINPREKIILSAVIQNFITTASPVSSALIARKSHLNMSPATIRNVMAELERKGFIYQPHTSAGRVPTDYGYRYYVDMLMRPQRLSPTEKETIRETLQHSSPELDEIMKEATRILAHLSRQLGVVVSPHVERGIFERMEIISLSSERILIVISIKSGLVKTITLELESRISRNHLQILSRILNERLYGLQLSEIRKNFREIVKDIKDEKGGLIQIFLRFSDQIFDFEEEKDVLIMGTNYILQQPEFSDLGKFSSVVELLENRDIIVHLIDEENDNISPKIKIGEEIPENRMQHCSIITTKYRVGNITGSLGIIGPKRMNYSKIVALVQYTAKTITDIFDRN